MQLRWANLDRASRCFSWIDVVVLCGVCVLFFFPAHAGSFSAVRGPVTAFRAEQKARIFRFILGAALARLLDRILPPFPSLWRLVTPLPAKAAGSSAFLEFNCALLI